MAIKRLQNFIQICGQSGTPLFKGKVRVYLEGTNTLAPLYGTEGGLVISNPVNIDGLGFVDIWADNGDTYRVEIVDQRGSIMKTFHNVSVEGSDSTVYETKVDAKAKTETYGIEMREGGTNTLQFYRPTL